MRPRPSFRSNKERLHWSKSTMKPFRFLALAAAILLVASCQKPQTEAERNAQIDREVQQRLAAERQADEQQRLAQQQADLAAREKALADKEAAADTKAAQRAGAQVTVTPRPALAATTDTSEPESYDTFYRKLEPYGAWRETSDYGYVWQPEQAQRSSDWRPYADGRWAYTDAGWTWISEEPFGWATYHYGRWIRIRNVGWVWVPGEEWAPAWVSWRTSDQYVGWAPLPPEARFERRQGIQRWADSYYDIDADEYVFVPNEAIGSPRLVQEVVPVERNVTIVNQTVNVTNITYNNVTIVNEGPNFEQLRARSRQPIQRFKLERRASAGTDSPQAVVRGDVLAVTTPVFRAKAVERPRVVGEPIAQVSVERNWAPNRNEAEAQRAREKMKSEATPPPDAPTKRYEKPKMVGATPAPAAAASPGLTATPIASVAASPRATLTPTARPTATASPALTAMPSSSLSPTAAAAGRASTTPIATPSVTPKPTASLSPIPPGTSTLAPSASASPTLTPPVRQNLRPKPALSATPTPTMSPSPMSPVTAPSTPVASVAPSPTPPARRDVVPRPGVSPVPGASASEAPSIAPLVPPARRGPQPIRSLPPSDPAGTIAPAITPPAVTTPAALRPRPAAPDAATSPFVPPASSSPRTVPQVSVTPQVMPSPTPPNPADPDAAPSAQDRPAGGPPWGRNRRGPNRRPQRPLPADTDPSATPSVTPQVP